jgi:hypothetical protein
MNIKFMSNMARIDKYKLRFLKRKVWFFINCFIFMPAYTWFLLVYLEPQLDPKSSLDSWLEFWTWILILGHVIFNVYIFIGINDLREKIERIEDEMDGRPR